MHNKFTIIDRQEVWTGSMNYTITDGYRNNNNLLRNPSAPLAQSYTAEFDEMFEHYRPATNPTIYVCNPGASGQSYAPKG